MRVTESVGEIDWPRLARIALVTLFLLFAVQDARLLHEVLTNQPLGLDFLPLWTATHADPASVYDFAAITQQQAWLYEGKVRPFIYPPSALLFLRPFGLLPFWVAYTVFITSTAAFFLWGARRIGADWRYAMMPPVVILVALAGQVTFLIGGLIMTALSLRNRPGLAGILLGIAGAIKPQMLVLLPVALLAEGKWRTLWVTAATAALLIVASLPLGASWLEWAQALPRFHRLVASDWSLVKTAATPYAAWGQLSLIPAVPAALLGVWLSFRSNDVPRRVLALLGGALLISPYAMNYEVALLVPAVLALEKPPTWTLLFWGVLALLNLPPFPLIIAIALLLRDLWARRDPNHNLMSAPAPKRIPL
jgi:hypothetical protein